MLHKSYIDENGFVRCPVCGGKTRTKIRPDTCLENFPLFCPKCKSQRLIGMQGGVVTVQGMGLRED